MDIVLYILLSLVIFSLGSSVLVCFFYWYETLNTPCPQLNQPKASFLSVSIAFARFVAMRAFRISLIVPWLCGKYGRRFKEENKSKKPCVVLVHGLYDSRSSWYLIKKELRINGYQVRAFGYNSFKGDTDSITEKFNLFMEAEGKKHPEQQFLLVGHSLGGLILRNWLKDKDNQKVTKGLIALGTPHKGTKLVVFLPGKLAADLRPDSDFLAKLNAQEKPNLPCIAYASGADDVVLPASSLIPPVAWDFKDVSPADHLGILFHKDIIKLLLEDLEKLSDTP